MPWELLLHDGLLNHLQKRPAAAATRIDRALTTTPWESLLHGGLLNHHDQQLTAAARVLDRALTTTTVIEHSLSSRK